jgi:hypothetical protein
MDKSLSGHIANISNGLHKMEELVESMEMVLASASISEESTLESHEDDLSIDIDMFFAVDYIVHKLGHCHLPEVRYQIHLHDPTKTTPREARLVFYVLRSICLQIMQKSKAADLQIEVTEEKSLLSVEINYYYLKSSRPNFLSSGHLMPLETFLKNIKGELDVHSTQHHIFFTVILQLH